MESNCKSIIRAAYHSFRGTVFVGTVLLVASGAQAQNLFVSDFDTKCIYEFTPSGTQSTFTSGLVNPAGLAFDSVGNLFVADRNLNSSFIYAFTTQGFRST